MRRIVSGLMLMLLLISMLTLAFNTQSVKAEPGTITVPDDYTTIQQAINAAKPGDTIYVRKGTYDENVIVNQSVSLIGENRKTTIVNGSGGDVFQIQQNYVNITGFTITNGYYGILIWAWGIPNHCNIIGNNITANHNIGVFIRFSLNNTVSGNQITYNGADGINLACSNNTVVSGNNIIANSNYGIYHSGSSNNIISGNNIENNGEGIACSYPSNYNIVSGNNIIANGYYGLDLSGFSNGTITENTIESHSVGVFLSGSLNNHIYRNNFINNAQQVFNYSLTTNVWNKVYPYGGNYWSDYNGTDMNHDGLGDTPYIIDSNNIDHYPLMTPWRPLKGDVNGDGVVNILDVVKIASIYGCKKGKPTWNPFADLAPPYGKIDIIDLVTCIYHYGQKYP